MEDNYEPDESVNPCDNCKHRLRFDGTCNTCRHRNRLKIVPKYPNRTYTAGGQRE